MKNNNASPPAVRQYIKEVSDRLICPKGTKKFFMVQFEDLVCSYAAEHPEASYSELCKEFGEPEKISTDIVEKAEYREMLKKAKKKTVLWIAVAAVAVVIIAFLIWFIAYLIKEYGSVYTVSPAYGHETIAETMIRIGRLIV